MREPRLEIQAGLCQIIGRGNNRQLIFASDDDYRKFLLQLAHQKARLPFYLYAYCLMPNHIHLLIERQDYSISRVMQRLLTVYMTFALQRGSFAVNFAGRIQYRTAAFDAPMHAC